MRQDCACRKWLTGTSSIGVNQASRCLDVSHAAPCAARPTCQGAICTRFEDASSRRACSGIRSSLGRRGTNWNVSRAVGISHMSSSSQLRGEDLSRAVLYTSAVTERALFRTPTMQTLRAKTPLKLLNSLRLFSQRRLPWVS